MGNAESRPSPAEDRHRGAHGGDRNIDREREPGRSSQAAGKDPNRTNAQYRQRPQEERVIETARPDKPDPVDTDPGAGPPGSIRHVRGWREGDPDADSIMPGRQAGAGGGKIDGPADAGGQSTGARPSQR